MKPLAMMLMLFFQVFSATANDEAAIRAILARQQSCWNAGDLECFMEGYWKSAHLTFIGSKGITYGWAETLLSYKKNYPNPTAMGELKFDIKLIRPLGEEYMYVVGQWQLTRTDDSPGGHFSLVWQKIEGEWVIISDHSS
ncbi:MAG: nuclear transport factor 2 family protein [Cyclobacteriaceae bacterium]|nr:nuclear transport factor 2 family protein [Cyclobacteriaceae bacterium]